MKRSQFGQNLRKLREKYGLEAHHLSDELNLGTYGRQTISNWENGRREPSLYMVCQIADFFGVSTDWLLGKEKTEDTGKYSELDSLIIINTEGVSDDDIKKIRTILNAFFG